MMYGLLGKNLTHSFSKDIHSYFGNNNYNIYNVDNIEDFFKNEKLSAFNVTIPYKNKVIKYLDVLDEVAKKTQSVNTVVFKDDLYYGYNTDYYGFIATLSYYNVDVKNKKIVLLGNGSVSNTIVLALNELEASKITRLCRTVKEKYDDTFENFYNYLDADIIINTTPVGMYPNNDNELSINLSSFRECNVVIDLIYNPLRTKLLIEAEELGCQAINGLYMLIMQAKKAHELFFNCDLPLSFANKVYKKIMRKTYNIVFIGMPLSGKSKYAKILHDKLNKKMYDTDNEIEKYINTTISDFFSKNSEEEFRMFETEVIKIIHKEKNCIISTGGGAVLKNINISLLKQNGVIIFLNKDPKKIAEKEIKGRPLIKNSEDVLRIAEKRLPLYKKACDISIDLKYDTMYHINEIKEKIDEYFNY
ncbi:MAG: shikimate kinase [Candidatus Izemoplasmatales bacterium]|nr:shikimate kinase [Candidatus Izemoplasmatales bacterium]